MTTTTKPLVPITTGQIKALFTIAKRRGMTHEDLRAAGGVESLKQLSVVRASELLDQLQLADYRGDYKPPSPDRAKARNVLRFATERQRTYVASLLDRLGWNDEKARRWLRRRHSIRDLAGGTFSTAAASQIVLELESALRKQQPTAVERGGSTTA